MQEVASRRLSKDEWELLHVERQYLDFRQARRRRRRRRGGRERKREEKDDLIRLMAERNELIERSRVGHRERTSGNKDII